MSYVEEKSYSSNVVRVLKPTTSTTTHHVQSDSAVSDCAALENKIDYLLEDLQKAVPPSSYKQSSPGLDDIGSPQRANMQQLHNSSYRQEITQSSSSYGGSGRRALSPQRLSERQSTNTNQLDSLLRDLEQERNTVEGDYSGTKNVYSSNQYNSTIIEPADMYSVVVPNERSHLIEETNDTYGRRKGTNRVITETRTYDGGVLLNDTEFRKDVSDQSLSQGILPRPGTKVTTTVRTYTYEVPFEGDSYSTSTTLSRSGVGGRNNLQRIEYLTNTENSTDTTTRVRRHNEFRDEVDSRNLHIIPVPGTNRERSVSPNPGSPTNPNSVVTYYKKEYSTSKNVHSDKSPEPYLSTNHHSPHSPPLTNKHPQYPGTYDSRNIYQTTTTTSIKNTLNNNRYPPAENFYHPPPFPTDSNRNGYPNSGAPGRVDDLMASLEINSNDMRSVNERDIDFERRKEVETAIATSKEPHQPLENIVGPPVYYPPGKKVSMMKEEGGGGGGAAASAAGGGYSMKGGYERASGRYEYEASSKSKSKSSSGAAVVPVCLPLCCAMPCSIM